MQDTPNQKLLLEIDAFIAETGMGVSYFGKMASGNSEVVHRLRSGGGVLLETADKIREFMATRRSLKSEQSVEA